MSTAELPLANDVSLQPSAVRPWLGRTAALLLVLTLGVALRMHDLGAECFDCDELYAVRLQGLTPRTIGAVMARDAFHTNHPPLMTVPYVFWVAAFGADEASVRLLPMLLSLATIAITFALGCRLAGSWVGFLGALLVAVNPLQIAYAQEARHYAMLCAATAAAHLLFVRCLQDGRRRDRVWYGLVCLLAVFTHYFAVIALAPHGLLALWLLAAGNAELRRRSAQALLTLVVALLPFLAWTPVIPHQSAQPWLHLRDSSAANIADCLGVVAGLGVGALALPGALLAGVLIVCGVVRGGVWVRGATEAAVAPPLPQRWGLPLLGGGLLLAAAASVAVPRLLLPMAQQVLDGYGYAPAIVAQEVRLLYWLTILFPLTLVPVGLVLHFWTQLTNVASRGLWQLAVPVPAAPTLVGVLLLTPLALVWLIGLAGVPILQPRNLLILTVPLCLALAFGLVALWRSPGGKLLAGAALFALALSYSQYDPVARVLGSTGTRLGMHTPDWRVLADALPGREADEPVVTFQAPASDPALYYLAEFQPKRVTADEAARLPAGRLFYVHLTTDSRSEEVLRVLVDRGARLDLEQPVGPFVVYRLSLPSR